MFHKPHQKHSSLLHIDRNKIYTLDIPFCDLIPAPTQSISDLEAANANF